MRVGQVAVATIIVGTAHMTAVTATAAVPEWHETLRHNELYPVAGTGEPGNTGDGESAAEAQLGTGLRLDIGPDGTLSIADNDEDALRTVSADGVIDSLQRPPGSLWAAAAAPDGSMFASTAHQLWRVDAQGGVPLADVAGFDIAVDAAGTAYVAEYSPGSVQAVSADGVATVLAGRGEQPFDSAAGPVAATSVQFDEVASVAVDSTARVYFVADPGGDLPDTVHTIEPDGTLTTLIGTQPTGFSGDGGPVAQARFGDVITAIAVGPDDSLYVADFGNGFVRRISADGVVTTLGPGIAGIQDVAVSPDGTIYVAVEARVYAFSPSSQALPGASVEEPVDPGEDQWSDEEPGTRTTVVAADDDRVETLVDLAVGPDGSVGVVQSAEDDVFGHALRLSDDGGSQPIESRLGDAFRLDLLADGSAVVADHDAVVRAHADGGVSQIAALGSFDVTATGVPSALAAVDAYTVAASRDGELYLSDVRADAIYRVDSAGVLTPFVEDLAAAAMAVAPDGTLYVAEFGGDYGVSAVEPDGSVTAVEIDEPAYGEYEDVAVGQDETLYVSDDHAVYRIDPDGERLVVADDGHDENSVGSGFRLATDPHGNLYVGNLADGSIEVVACPTELKRPLPWVGVGVVAAVLVAGVVVGILWRRRRREGMAAGEASPLP